LWPSWCIVTGIYIVIYFYFIRIVFLYIWVWPGTDVMIFQIFLPKNSAKKIAFLTPNKAKLCKILIITLVFEKNANFFAENWGKSQKIVIITSTPGWDAYAILISTLPRHLPPSLSLPPPQPLFLSQSCHIDFSSYSFIRLSWCALVVSFPLGSVWVVRSNPSRVLQFIRLGHRFKTRTIEFSRCGLWA
jgi:hypothetical protein